MIEKIKNDTKELVAELVETAKLKKGDILVVGCSSSEVAGQKIGTYSSLEIGKAIFDGIQSVLKKKGVFLAAQCCEHLNRAVIVEAEAVLGYDIVNAVPQLKAGGSFATAAYEGFKNPVAVEEIRADAGLDIGGTLIGMHLKRVAVPIRLKYKVLGEANITAARVRPKYIGGERTSYDENLG